MKNYIEENLKDKSQDKLHYDSQTQLIKKELESEIQNNDFEKKKIFVKSKIAQADAIVIGAGAGLSTAAGFTYSGERFEKYFPDFRNKYGLFDMYSGGFYDYDTLEEYWAYWSRYVYINRYMNPPTDLYKKIYNIVKDKEYFVLTTNVDHCFQKAGFDKDRLFYTQGDYGLFQCSKPCHYETYDNREVIEKMVLSQGFIIDNGILEKPAGSVIKRTIPTSLIPHCPKCGRPLSMNLRADSTFVQDEGWKVAAIRYENFIKKHKKEHIVFVELGVGYNTPGIIKYPFWQYTYNLENAFYICINKGQSYIPKEIEDKSIGIDGDIADIVINTY